MSNVKIFCEGITDQIFIADCIELFFNVNVKRDPKKRDKHKLDMNFGDRGEIIEIEGCTKLVEPYNLDKLRDNTEEGGRNIVIFDADYSDTLGEKQNTGNKGFLSATQKLNDIKKHHNVVFEHYLWHNNREDGEVEHLLRQLIPPEKETIFQCISNHQNCLKKIPIDSIKVADLKEQLGYYLYTINKKSEVRYRDYKEIACWHLDCDKISDLMQFRKFLQEYFVAEHEITSI